MMKEILEDWKEYLMILAGATMLTAVIVIIGIALTAALFSVVSWLGWLR